MNAVDSLRYLLVWSLIGIVLFNLYVILVFRTGIVYTTRKEDGTLKESPPLSGVLNSLLLLMLIVGLLLLSNWLGLHTGMVELPFLQVFLLNYGLYFILFLYDTYAIDAYVIGHWRPSFLRIPEAMNAESMREHIRASWLVAPIIGLVLAGASAGLYVLLR
jgi:hypothetical protein